MEIRLSEGLLAKLDPTQKGFLREFHNLSNRLGSLEKDPKSQEVGTEQRFEFLLTRGDMAAHLVHTSALGLGYLTAIQLACQRYNVPLTDADKQVPPYAQEVLRRQVKA